jgi:general secretion pathway protein A
VVVPQIFIGRGNTRNFIVANGTPQLKSNLSVADFPESLRIDLSGLTESESAKQGINALAKLWKVPEFPTPQNPDIVFDLDRLATERSLKLSRFNGNLGALVRMNVPVLLELTLPGVQGKRYLALTGAENDRYFIAPVIHGRHFITGSELDRVWSGRSYLLWKNYLNIPPGLKNGTAGEATGRLQSLLKQAGVYHGSLTGAFDQATVAAIKSFQVDRGIEPDGLAGNQTLLLLYRSAGAFYSPELTKRGRLRQG